MANMTAKIIADSISESGKRITTMHLRYPRFIHAELMTHRVLSRNARSSRAVPVKKMLEEISRDPVIPSYWGKNQSGMQASEENNEMIFIDYGHGSCDFTREGAWLYASEQAVRVATEFMKAGYHKQVVNRLLEPFMYIDTLVTATDWENFMFLRDHKDAEPHIRDLAIVMKEAMKDSTPNLLRENEWHMPYITEEDKKLHATNVLLKISVARSARISYAAFDDDGSVEKELERYKLLVESVPLHASPAEHQAKPDRWDEHKTRTVNQRKGWQKSELHGNLTGWIQYRKMLDNEFVKG